MVVIINLIQITMLVAKMGRLQLIKLQALSMNDIHHLSLDWLEAVTGHQSS
jgi:hypothetical protein